MNAKHFLFPLFFGSVCAATSKSHAQVAKPKNNALHFVENKGQVTDQYGSKRNDIHFRVGERGLNLFVGGGQLHYQWAATTEGQLSDQSRTAMYRMDVILVGADPQAKPETAQQLDYYEKYYQPAFGEGGATAHAFQKITYRNVYPNIDWVLYEKNGTIEYDFVVKQGGKVSDIRLQYDGATQLSLDKEGKLTAVTPMGSITENTPASYQSDGNTVASSFVLQGNTFSFATAPYSGTLTIDPTLNWSTFYGGTASEALRNGCVSGDKFGNGYLCGATQSATNIATTGSYKDTITGSNDAWLVKFDGTGIRKWATYYGGSASESTYGTTCDSLGNVYVTGYTASASGIATTGAYQTTSGGGTDAFLVKFDTAGNRLWGTYFGGSSSEQCYGVACDRSNNVYISGYTQSSNGIASSTAYQNAYGGSMDAFVAKFSSVGTIQWSTYYGGTGSDYGQAVACDGNNNVYLTGYTRSTTGIATAGAFQTAWGGNANDDGYLVKFDSTGSRLWGTYYGGNQFDRAMSVCTDPNNNVYITGGTGSTSSIATVGSVQDTLGGANDYFLAKFNNTGTRQWATYYGGTGNDNAAWICADGFGNLYVFGTVLNSTGLAVPGTWQDTLNGTSDGLLVKFDTAGVRKWATYFGGDASESAYGVYCNYLSKVFIGGQTTSINYLATTNGFQTTNGGGTDGFIAVFNDCLLIAPANISGNDTVCRNAVYTYTVPAMPGASSYSWILPSGWSGSSTTNSINITTGISSDTIKVTANYPCGSSTITLKPVFIIAPPTINSITSISICNGDSTTLTTNSGTAYQWLQNGTAITGATTQNYTTHLAGIYSVAVTNTQGCSDTSLTDTVTVHSLPVPTISSNGAVLSTGNYATYQWNRNGTLITGAINDSYTITVFSGNYTVTVTDANGCSGTSAPFDASQLGVYELNGKNVSIDIYPNPVSDYLNITSDVSVNITISSADGRTLATYKNAKHIDLKNYASGLYLLRITDKNGAYLGTKKIIKHTY